VSGDKTASKILAPDTQHNDIQHTDTQHYGLIYDNQHIRYGITTVYHYAECRVLFVVKLNVVMLSVFTLSVIMLSVFTLSIVMPSVVMLSIFMLSVVMLNVFTLSVGTKILAAPFLAPKRLLLHSNSYLPSYFHSELGLL
jgi:hypothetical protein